MKKNLFYLSMLAVALLAGSCSSDLDEGQTPDAGGGQAITFKVWANKQLRAATVAGDVKDFAVLATNDVLSSVLIDGEIVSGGNGAWTYAPKGIWPDTDPVNFYAYSPAAATGITPSSSTSAGGSTAALAGQDDVNTGDPFIEYTLPLAVGTQEDLLVARHQGTYATEGQNGVKLNFRHALSRIKFQAKSANRANFTVQGIRLKNIKRKATLELKQIPDAEAFPYPTDDATLTSQGYQTFWTLDGSASVVDLEANLTTADVLGATTGWTDVVGDNDALYIIPQENLANTDYPSSTELTGGPGSGASTGFYIEITYIEVGLAGPPPPPVTYAVPVKAIVGTDPDASSIAFEMERQYTFRFELSGSKPIEFTDITVNGYDEVAPFPATYTATANGGPTSTSTRIDFVFDQDVPGLLADDIILSAGAVTKGALTRTDNKHYSLAITPVTDGLATVKITKTRVSDNEKEISINAPYTIMIPVAGGVTALGSEPSVTISDFQIGKYEVTQQRWLQVMGSWPGNAPSASYGSGDNYPAYYISWEDIVGTTAGSVGYVEKGITYYTDGFCYKLSVLANGGTLGSIHYRLPTEAEWEYAAKGGQATNGYTYSGSNTLDEVGWYSGNSGNRAHIAGTAPKANELGIYDMSGNIWEWCGDWYDAGTYPSGATDPIGVATGSEHVHRGGGWGNPTTNCTVSARRSTTPTSRSYGVGFRLALSIIP